MAILYILIGVVVGIAGIFIAASYMAKQDNSKYDTTNEPEKPLFQEQPPTWSTTTIVTETVKYDDARRGTKQKQKEKSLEDQLTEALENEEYLKAAELRDKINKNKNKK